MTGLLTFTVVLVEDDVRLARLTTRYLENHGLVVHHAADGAEGLQMALAQSPDVLVVDVMLPSLDGLALCRAFRQRSHVPIVLLTARDQEYDRIQGLEAGADDYVLKPFSSPELLARLRAQVRRARGLSGPPQVKLEVGDLTLDVATRSARVGQAPLLLTTYEFSLLCVLVERAGVVLSRDQLMELVRGTNDEVFDRSIDVHVSHLRQKLGDDPRNPRRLKTVRGVGYVYVKGAQ
jgi:DNA-binding response OmpR family regulator